MHAGWNVVNKRVFSLFLQEPSAECFFLKYFELFFNCLNYLSRGKVLQLLAEVINVWYYIPIIPHSIRNLHTFFPFLINLLYIIGGTQWNKVDEKFAKRWILSLQIPRFGILVLKYSSYNAIFLQHDFSALKEECL